MSVFLPFALILVTGLFWVFTHFQRHFSSPQVYVQKIDRLQNKIFEQELRVLRERARLREFRWEVAEILQTVPRPLRKKEEFPLRQLASVVEPQSSDLESLRSATLLQRGKALFREQELKKANQLFSEYLRQWPQSVRVPETLFLKAEAEFQLGDFESSLKTIETMVDLFPQNELTGFSLIRMSQVYQSQKRTEEAVEILKTVIHAFPYREVMANAAENLRQLGE